MYRLKIELRDAPYFVDRTRLPLILAVDDDPDILTLISIALGDCYSVMTEASVERAFARLSQTRPDLIISDVTMPEVDGFEFVRRLRADPVTNTIPVIMLTGRTAEEDVVAGLNLGADDYMSKPFTVNQLQARVQSKLLRPPVPRELGVAQMRAGWRTGAMLVDEIKREVSRTSRGGNPGSLAFLYLDEMARVHEQLGAKAEREILTQVERILTDKARALDTAGYTSDGYFVLLLPETLKEGARVRINRLMREIESTPMRAGDEEVRLTPCAGYVEFSNGDDHEEVMRRARVAVNWGRGELDLEPVMFAPSMDWYVPASGSTPAADVEKHSQEKRLRLSTIAQIVVTLSLSLVFPYFVYAWLDQLGLDITPAMYLVVVVALLVTAIMIWVEGVYAARQVDPPMPGAPYPAASAIVAAYLPNEAATILESIKAFRRVRYPGPLEIIIAYNTPRSLPIEQTLQEIAARDPRFVPLRVEGSESKAQNINAALANVHGEFVGVFDADHQPDPHNFTRAWRWLSNGYDVVQGHCLVRNGAASWISKLIAVEFEAIYAVSHPGRARLYQFGIFGGSNGYWKTNLLRAMRMRRFMLTEDIDSSLRAVMQGKKIVNDPLIVSRELAPATVTALWNQRIRWAQGWFQVSKRHLWEALTSRSLTLRQKLGVFWLLGWRELYPWLSVQMFPIIAFWVVKYGGLDKLDWLVPIFVLTTLFTLSVGPGQAVLAYVNADPQIRRHKSWFVYYLVMSSLFYAEFKNIIARVAQIKEATHERKWRITPRQAQGTALEGGQA